MRTGDSARKHQVADEGMLHALRNHIRKFDTDEVTMFIGPAEAVRSSRSVCSISTRIR